MIFQFILIWILLILSRSLSNYLRLNTKNISRPLPSLQSKTLPLYWILWIWYLHNYMGFAQRLCMLANISLVRFFGDLLRLGKSRNPTSGINSKTTLSSMGDWLGVCWYMTEKNISRSSWHKLTNTKNVLFLYRQMSLIIIRKWLHSRRNWNLL